MLGVSCKSCNDVVRGELGRYPVLLMTMNQWFKYAKHCYSLPCDNFTRASLSGLCDYTTCPPYHVISSVYCRFNVVFNENALHHPALPLYVQEHAMLKYQRAWLSSINKGYDPKKPNKLKVYASIKKSFSLEKYVSCYNIAKRRNFTKLRISSHHLAIEKGRYTRPIPCTVINPILLTYLPDQSPQENNVFAIIAQKKLLAMRCISFWGVQNLYLKGVVSSMTLINYMA